MSQTSRSASAPEEPDADEADRQQVKHLHITVNRRKFTEETGVHPQMTGRQIAALVDVPADNAVVRLENGPDAREIGAEETVAIHTGQKFLVTRKTVEGGYGSV